MFALLEVRLGQFYKKTFMKCTFVLLLQLIAYITDFLFWINWGKKSSNQNHNIITIQQKWHIKYRLHKDSRGVTSRIQLCRCCDNIGNVSTFYMLQHYEDTNKNSVWKNELWYRKDEGPLATCTFKNNFNFSKKKTLYNQKIQK